MNFKLFMVIVRARLLLILFTLTITVATGVFLSSLQAKRYTATTSIVLNFENDTPFDQAGIPAQLSSNYVATQLDILRSRKVALKVVEKLDMENDPEVREAYLLSGETDVSMRDWLAAAIMPNLTVEPLRDSRVVNISYEAFSPRRAAEIANAYAEAFIATTLELSTEPARRNAEWFDEQLKVLRARLEQAQARLTAFQQDKGIVALDERLGTEQSRLADLSSSLVDAQDELYDVRSRQLGQNHPEYQRAIQRERSLRNSLEEQKRRILELRSQRDELEALAREVEVEQQTYEATLQNYYNSLLESQFNQTNISVLTPALPPQRPSSPNVLLNVLSAIVLGLIISLALAIGIELLNRRIRTRQDVTEFLDTRVLATV